MTGDELMLVSQHRGNYVGTGRGAMVSLVQGCSSLVCRVCARFVIALFGVLQMIAPGRDGWAIATAHHVWLFLF